jgi:hypothetical protein
MGDSGYYVFFEAGCSFHKTANGAVKRPEVFTPEIIQNIVAMAIEKYFMAIFIKRGFLPLNHTMSDLVSAAMSMSLPIEPEILETLYYMDNLQQICSLDTFKIITPTPSDVPRFLKAVAKVAKLATKELQIEIEK